MNHYAMEYNIESKVYLYNYIVNIKIGRRGDQTDLRIYNSKVTINYHALISTQHEQSGEILSIQIYYNLFYIRSSEHLTAPHQELWLSFRSHNRRLTIQQVTV